MPVACKTGFYNRGPKIRGAIAGARLAGDLMDLRKRRMPARPGAVPPALAGHTVESRRVPPPRVAGKTGRYNQAQSQNG